MSIGKIINNYGSKDSPYMGGLVNHLPMGQLALYKMTGDLEKVRAYSQEYLERGNINTVKIDYPKKKSLRECLGKRNLYESCLDLIKEKSKIKGIHNLTKDILNKYILGMSSGLFHTLIRVAYGVEGCQIDKELTEELERALAYYITAYREGDLFTRKIPSSQIIDEMKTLSSSEHIRNLILSKDTLGQRMKSLYSDDEYLKLGFIIDGSEEEKIKALLKLLVPLYDDSGNIVVLHCITGLHALVVLQEYYYDFSKALDIFTTLVITHLLTIDSLEYNDTIKDKTELSWRCILAKGAGSTDVHAIKLAYSSYELDKIYGFPELKDSALKRIRHM